MITHPLKIHTDGKYEEWRKDTQTQQQKRNTWFRQLPVTWSTNPTRKSSLPGRGAGVQLRSVMCSQVWGGKGDNKDVTEQHTEMSLVHTLVFGQKEVSCYSFPPGAVLRIKGNTVGKHFIYINYCQ